MPAPGAEQFLPERISLASLRRAAADCRGRDLPGFCADLALVAEQLAS